MSKDEKGAEKVTDVQEVYESPVNLGGAEFKTASRDPVYRLEVKEAGTYQVLASYTPGSNRTETAVYEIPTANGVQTITVNQQERPKGPFCFQPLGEFSFEAGLVAQPLKPGDLNPDPHPFP